MLSLCYLPTAGRLTLTVIKARNLKAMDITGKSGAYKINRIFLYDVIDITILPKILNFCAIRKSIFHIWTKLISIFSSDPYVKVYLLCQGKRIKKKKTTVKKNTLYPVYNEALVFDVPADNIEDVSLIVKVIDYDR